MNTKDLLCHSQVHGVKRLIERRHRLYWASALTILLCCAISNLLSTIMRFSDAPTHLVMQDTIRGKTLFPAVMVCPEVYFPDYKIQSLLKNARYPANMTAHSIRPFIKQISAFYSPDVPYSVDNLSRVIEFLEYNELDVEEAGLMLTPTCEETLLRCRFLQKDYNCSDIFHMEITMYGFCCTFNGKSLKREMNAGKGDWILRGWDPISVSGAFSSLMVAVNQSQHMDNVDLTYKWLVVQKNRYVDGTSNGTALSPETEIYTSFQAQYLEVTEDSRFLGDSLRGCRMETKDLNYFKHYNEKNCIMECRMEKLLRRCHCLLPYHYRAPGVPLCDAASLPCATKCSSQFDPGHCDCPRTCYYQFEIIKSDTYPITSAVHSIDSFYHGLNLSRVTGVRVYLKSHKTTSFYRRPYYNFYDLFSQLGGVFNVFFGCSIISILELMQLAWHSLNPKPRRKKRDRFFFRACCRGRRRRVGKRLAKKKAILMKSNKVFYSY